MRPLFSRTNSVFTGLCLYNKSATTFPLCKTFILLRHTHQFEMWYPDVTVIIFALISLIIFFGFGMLQNHPFKRKNDIEKNFQLFNFITVNLLQKRCRKITVVILRIWANSKVRSLMGYPFVPLVLKKRRYMITHFGFPLAFSLFTVIISYKLHTTMPSSKGIKFVLLNFLFVHDFFVHGPLF